MPEVAEDQLRHQELHRQHMGDTSMAGAAED
jgi:hypothetical protein